MHILRWLLTHPIIFAWVLAILAILLNYSVGGGSGDDTHQASAEHSTEQAAAEDADAGDAKTEDAAEGEVVAKAQNAVGEVAKEATDTAEAAVEGVKEAVAEATDTAGEAVEEVKEVVTEATDSASGTVAKVAAVAGAATAAVAAGSAAADSGEESAETSEETQAAADATETAQATEEAEASEEAQAADSTETAEATQAEDATDTAEAGNESTQAADAETSDHDLLHAAREAYWSDEFDRSAEFYQTLLQRASQPEVKGELANVFWKQGKSAEALALYAEIAPWLREQGRTHELQNMKVYADIVDPAKGEEIGTWLE